MNTIDNAAAPDQSHAFTYERGRDMRRYMIAYGLVALAGSALWGGVGSVLIPLHVQQIEFAQFFAGAMASVNLQELVALKAQIAAGAAKATAEQQRLLDALAAYETAKAGNLSMLKSIAFAATMLMQPLIGVVSDRTRSRWGRRAPWILVGAAMTLAGLIGMKYSTSIVQLLLAWVVTQVGSNVVMSPLAATVADRMPAAQRGLMSAVAGVGLLVGFMLGTVTAGALFGKFGVGSYLAFAVALFVFSASFVMVSRDLPSSAMRQQAVSARQHLLSFTHALRSPDFRWVWVARVLVMVGWSTSAVYSVYMLQSYIQPALSAAEAAKTVAIMHLVTFPGTLLAMVITGRWSDRIMRRRPFVIGASFLFAASMIVPLFWPTLTALYVQTVLAGMAVGTFLVVDQALLIDVLPNKDHAGRDMGIGQFAINLGQVMGPIVASVVFSATGGYRMIWAAALVVLVLSAFALLPVKTR
ncbi:MFS transporter [Caenimonas sp. SL110]|uniref:MFS transporter n=1 Tax=Caenimonas sp. SL110 TaxID=1450524 RepID=UPI000653A910|nr:MFS transporter [Caenimonas sp. SL110]